MNNKVETKRVIKKDVKIKIIIGVIAVVILIVIISLICHFTSPVYKLTKLGYSKNDSKEIVKLNKTDKVLSKEHCDKMLEILKNKYFMDKNMDTYLEYYKANNNKSIDDVIAIVNVHANNEFYSDLLDSDTSKGTGILINKYFKVNNDYVPDNLVDVSNWYAYGEQKLVDEAYQQYMQMFNAAKKENLTILINDSYRSFEEQEKSYKKYGDDYAARPGHSEHNTGLAVDVVSPSSNGDNFDQTEEFKWLQEHSYEYGFILRYPKDKEYLTGYEYESWHYRYLGTDLAKKVHDSGLTYDEYYAFNLDGQN